MDRTDTRLRLPWPRFDDPAEEARFRADHDAALGLWVAGHAPLLVAVVLGSALIEWMLFPRAVWLPVSALLVASIALPVLAIWRLARRPVEADRVYRAVRRASASAAIGVVLVVSWPRSQGLPQPYEGILLVMMGIFVISGLRSRDACLINALCVAGVAVVEASWPTSLQDGIVHLSFAVGVYLLGGVFSLTLERADRRDFRHRETLQALALRDPLTGALNRRGLERRYDEIAGIARREQKSLAVAVVDIDHFKAYNDHYGHEAGDAVLVAVSAALARQARRPLDLCARIGGEEFVLAWYDVDEDAALALASAACEAVADLALPHTAAPATGLVTASIGVASLRAPADFESLYRLADRALYEAKRAGRNRARGAVAVGGPTA